MRERLKAISLCRSTWSSGMPCREEQRERERAMDGKEEKLLAGCLNWETGPFINVLDTREGNVKSQWHSTTRAKTQECTQKELADTCCVYWPPVWARASWAPSGSNVWPSVWGPSGAALCPGCTCSPDTLHAAPRTATGRRSPDKTNAHVSSMLRCYKSKT